MAKNRRPRQSYPIAPDPAPPADVRAIIREELTKALQLPPGTQTTQITTQYLQQLQQRAARPNPTAALTRDPHAENSFGPGVALYPAPLDQPLRSGRPAPRRWEYPVSWNLQTTTTRSVPWSMLRDSADQVSIMRSCIEVNKAALTGLEWSFGIDSARARHLAHRTGVSKQTVTSDLQDKYADQIEKLHTWWSKPDKINGWNFAEWLGALMEDQLVLDAVALYPHLQMNGDLHSLELLDSTTIKPLLDYRGATPQPPLAAYQQILFGFPRGEYEASPNDEVDAHFISAVYGKIEGINANTDTLIYKVKNRRSRGPYGFSNVEQALTDVDLWLKRFDWLRSEYTAGVAPEMLVAVEANMTPEQLREYESVFNDDLSGQNAERHRARFLPAGFTATYPQGHDSKFTSEFDLHLIRLICAAFDVMPTSLGFVPNSNSGMAGSTLQEGEQETQLTRATKPTAAWLTDMINEVSTHYLKMPPEVTFQFHGLDDEDEQREATLLTGYISSALQTLNEGRDQLNLPRYTFPEADEPFLATPTGPAWLNVEVQPVGMPGNLPSAAQNQPGYKNEPTDKAPVPQKTPRPASAPDKPRPKGGAVKPKIAVKAEQRAFTAFMTKRAGTGLWRDFEFTSVSPEVGEAANRLAAAGDVDAVKALFELRDDG